MINSMCATDDRYRLKFIMPFLINVCTGELICISGRKHGGHASITLWSGLGWGGD